jgi:hypothetical protein
MCIPVIPATREVETGDHQFKANSGKVNNTPSQSTLHVSVEISQWNSFIQLIYANMKEIKWKGPEM